MRKDPILRLFKDEMRWRFGDRLREIVLFGSRARGDMNEDSVYDCLAVFDEVPSEANCTADSIAGKMLLESGAVFSIFSIAQSQYRSDRYDPFLMVIRREGRVL